MGSMWVLFVCPFWVCKNVSCAIVLNVLILEGSAGGIGTMLTIGLLQSASLWSSIISLALILFHSCVSGVMT